MLRLPARLLEVPVAVVAALLLAALLAVAWFDYNAASRELMVLSRAHAASIRDTVTAAARANRAAALQAESTLTARLLDHARLLTAVDRTRRLTAPVLEDMVKAAPGLRVATLDRDGRRELLAGAPRPGGGRGRGRGREGRDDTGPHDGPGRGEGAGRGAGLGLGPGFGAGPGTALLTSQLLSGERAEVVTDVHTGRWGDVARLAAGVRRAGGGAILVSIDAAGLSDLQAQASIDRLLGDLIAGNPEIAYLVFTHGDVRYAHGDAPAAGTAGASEAGERVTGGGVQGVLDLTGPIDVGDGVPTSLAVGVRLDTLRGTERRTLLRLMLSLSSAVALGVVALGFIWLRRAYGSLSERHARAEQALRRRDRLAAMGEMASTVAHEIRNPLNAIAMSAQRLARESFSSGDSTDDDGRALVGVISAEAARIDRRVQEFLEFARAPRLDVRRVEIEPWVDGLADSARALAAAHDVAVDIASDARGSFDADPDQLRQALDNIVRNAVEATPAGGHVAVMSRIDGAHLVIEVADTGPGISPDDLPRIFDLYFTTKADGTGVGLAVAHQVVGAHGGTIEVVTPESGGVRMVVRVPLAADEATHA